MAAIVIDTVTINSMVFLSYPSPLLLDIPTLNAKSIRIQNNPPDGILLNNTVIAASTLRIQPEQTPTLLISLPQRVVAKKESWS